jgi:MYXO-CTERM domain-containing protein
MAAGAPPATAAPPGQQCSSATNAIGVCGDADTDGDGVPDRTEQRLGTSEFKSDSDGDGLPDNVELTPPGGGAFAAVDTDGDGTLDALDSDSDNDCAADKNETAQTYRDPAQPKAKADDNCAAAAPICDTRKGLCTITCSADSDCGGVGRVCGDGVPRTCIDGCHGGASPVGCPTDFACTSQTEALGLCKGIDSDGDGIDDVTEKKLGLDPTKKDSDGDGIDDFVETDGGKAIDTDGDGKIDALDEDSDGDGIPDRVETAADADGDKIGNYRDQDSDGDTITDAVEGTGDPDNDGKPNFLDLDSDGDTLPDQGETANDFDKDGLGNFVDTDSDNDCVPDQKEPAGGVLNPQIPSAVGDANCTNGAVCDGKTGTCTTTCGADRDCASGQVCDTGRKLCVAGCRGTGQANCKAGEFCKDGATGVGSCEKDPSLNSNPPSADDDVDLLQGGGIGCSTSSLGGGASLPFAALGLVGLAIVRRRRRNR